MIKTLKEYNKNYLHLTLRRLQALDGRQEQQTLVAKLLSRISYLDELHPWKLQIHWITLKATPKGLFIDHKVLLILNKLHQCEQSAPQNKGNSNPTQIWKHVQKRKLSDPILVD